MSDHDPVLCAVNGYAKDKKGRPIHAGDLVRSHHFRDRRWGHQYLYHVVCDVGKKYFEMRPADELNTGKDSGGRFWLMPIDGRTLEIIAGGGPFPDNVYQERQ